MTSKSIEKMVVMGVFDDRVHVERALTRLDAMKVDRSTLSVIAHPHTVGVEGEDDRTWKPENLVVKAMQPKSGAVAGTMALSATLVGIALFAVPLGALLVAGPVALVGGAVSAFGTPLVSPDTLGDLGVPRRDAKLAIEAVRRGAVVLVAQVDRRQARFVAEALDRAGAIDLYARASEWENEGWSYEPNAPVWSDAEIEREHMLRHPMRGIPRDSVPSYA
jgi:hypothetical protein